MKKDELTPTSLVFLVGLAGSGKDTVGQVFIDNGYTRVALADILKKEYAKANHIPLQTLHIQGPNKELYRFDLIKYAEAKRKEEPLYWVKKAIEPFLDTNNNIKEGLKLVFTDIRRISEIDWISSFKEINTWGIVNCNAAHYIQTKLFIIERTSIVDKDYLTHEAIGYAKGVHTANSDLHFIEAIITNNNSKEQLVTKIQKFLNPVVI